MNGGPQFIAKTYPELETIQSHTDRLLDNLKLLKNTYPNLNVDWDLLELACLFHDLGKINKKFQSKINGKKVKNEIPHGFLSIGFLDIEKLREKYSREKIKILVNAIAYHHERDFPISEYYSAVAEEITIMVEDIKFFCYDKLPKIEKLKMPSLRYINGNRVTERDGEQVFYDYVLVKGLLNRIDYASSAHERVEWPNDFLEDALADMMNRWKEQNQNASWNELQKYMIENRDSNIVAVAQTGMGKTEAGLLWIGNNKGFFTLPLRTALNAIYDRVRKQIVRDKIEERVGLLHSDAFSEFIKRADSEEEKLELEEIGLSKYHNRIRQLTMPLTICTIDQIFDFVYRYRGFEPKLATLAYSKIVIDEIQMYSPDLIAYLISGLSHITKLGGKFAILTATYPPFITDLLKKEGIEFLRPAPFLNDDESAIRHSVQVIDEMINAEFIAKKYHNNKVLVVCNTVKKAQELYLELIENFELSKEEVNLFHSTFIQKDRREKEAAIIKLGGKDNKGGHGIWICTQVVEASLDIDFDILITELSDLNGLFQRMGRCYRNRPFDGDGYNCYVLNGGEQKCTGVGYVIDTYIFNLSKIALKEMGVDGRISEKRKIEMIEEVFTTDKLRDSKYYRDIVDTLDYIKCLYTNEMDKGEAKRRFRNINSITVIPENVFRQNHEEIEQCVQILNEKYLKSMSKDESEQLKLGKAKARARISDFTVSIPYYLVNKNKTNLWPYQISEYEHLNILKCNYDSKVGITAKTDFVEETDLEAWDNIF
ncbi:MAG: CRISPR-associated helicase Cas3' [Bacteroidales bacterium]|nr:CRISPR-associated helicase Cas3' [Bacteroidales bacterium]